MVGAGDPQAEHYLGIGLLPPGSGQFKALLDDMAMGAFYFSGANRPARLARLSVMKMFEALAQVASCVLDRCFGHPPHFPMWLQGSENFPGLAQHQSGFLLFEPAPGFPGAGDFEGRCSQILADVVKIDQILALRAKVLCELLHDPGGTVAHPVHKGFLTEPTALGGLSP